MNRGFAGLMIFFSILPFILQFNSSSAAMMRHLGDFSSSFVSQQRARFFEANVRDSFTRALASARGQTPADLVADAALKVSRWAAASFDEGKARGYAPSLSILHDGESTGIDLADGEAAIGDLANDLQFNPKKMAMVVRYNSSSDSYEKQGSLLISFEKSGEKLEFLMPAGLYARTNSSSPTIDFGFSDD